MSSSRTPLSLFKFSACLICPVASFRASRRSVIFDSYSFNESLTILISPWFSWWYFCSSFLIRASTAVSGPERKGLFREWTRTNFLQKGLTFRIRKLWFCEILSILCSANFSVTVAEMLFSISLGQICSLVCCSRHRAEIIAFIWQFLN